MGSSEALAQYVGLLCAEIRSARSSAERLGAALPEHVDTLYFGGGTPSLLTPEQLSGIFHALRNEFRIAPDAEITMEAAPGQIGHATLAEAMRCGVNRISLGVQSFVDHETKAVGRSHTRINCLAEFARLRSEGVSNIGADLIAGLPYQTAASWEESLRIATEAGLDHLSVYMLEIDEDSRLGREVLGGGARLHAPAVASDDLIASLYETACRILPASGFAQYEISNFARHHRQSTHNLKYWSRQPYLGFGLDAHSMLQGADEVAVRWANPDDLEHYTPNSRAPEAQWIDERGAFEETVFLGLRLLQGLPWTQLDPFRHDWTAELADSVKRLQKQGLMASDTGRFWLTDRGRLVSGSIFGELLAGVAV